MSKALIIGGGVAIVLVMFGIASVFYVFGILNGEVSLRVRYEAQENVVESTMDNMRKTLMNQYSVSKEFAETFVKCVALQAEGRKGGSLFKSVTEASGNTPQAFTPELASKMMNSIEGKLSEFKRAQDVWVDVWREHKTYCSTMPNAIFVGGKVFPKPQVISSEVSKAAMESGKLTDKVLGN